MQNNLIIIKKFSTIVIEFIDEVVAQAETGWGITPSSLELTQNSPGSGEHRAALLTCPNGSELATDFCYLGDK
jgi:hypothetical protein